MGFEKIARAAAAATLLHAAPVRAQEFPDDGPLTAYEQVLQKKAEACAKNAVTLPDGSIQIVCRDYGDGDLNPDPFASVVQYFNDHYRGRTDIAIDTMEKHGNVITFRLKKVNR